MFVKEGQAVTVTNASVYVTDIDTKPGALTLTIVTPPTHGKYYADLFEKSSCILCRMKDVTL